MLPGVENLSGIRTFRVLRALRTISAVKGKFRLRSIYSWNEVPCFFCLSFELCSWRPVIQCVIQLQVSFNWIMRWIETKLELTGTDCSSCQKLRKDSQKRRCRNVTVVAASSLGRLVWQKSVTQVAWLPGTWSVTTIHFVSCWQVRVFFVAGLKAMVNTLLKSIRMLSDVLILTTFFLCVFALIGLQLFVGIMQWKCVRTPPGGWPKGNTLFDNYIKNDSKIKKH